jgi:uncharacterized protein (DUF342 family)
MTVRGDLNLEIDEQGIEVRITIVPDENGAEISPESLQALLAEKKVRAGIDSEAIDKAFRTLLRKKNDPVSFIAAAGTPPQLPTPESVQFEISPIPPRLALIARSVLAAAPQPRGYRVHEAKIKTEKKVLKKGALPFLRGREQVEVVVEKKTVREEVEIDPSVTETGFVSQGDLVARVQPSKPGREGRSVFGRLVPAPRPDQQGWLFCDGLMRTGSEVRSTVTGFLRKGANWCDVVAFRDHAIELAASADHLTCLLSLVPGDPSVPAPDVTEILDRAQKLGFSPETLIPKLQIEGIIQDALARKSPLVRKPITPTADGLATVTVSPDKLKAVLYLRKGMGGGRPLSPADASAAIRKSVVKGFNLETVQKDLRAFFDGATIELADYPLVQGRPPKPGAEPKLEWRALFLSTGEANKIKAQALVNAEHLKGLESLSAFPLERVEAVARVKPEAEVLRIVPSVGGEPGVDVFGATISPPKGTMPDVRLYEGLALRRDMVVATESGILEKGSDGMAILLRVRPQGDAELNVSISADRMKATLSYFPPQGDGVRISTQEVRARIGQAGVRKGINEERLLSVLESIARSETLKEVLIAEGKKPTQDAQKRIVFHVHIATGQAVALRADGRADFRAQDRITRVSKGELLATVRFRDAASEDGWDVTGAPIASPPEETLKAGRRVRAEVQTDGSVRFVAESDGELIRDGSLISVMDAHTIRGDVDMSTGNVNFPGIVHVTGSITSGFTVIAGGVLEVGEGVGGALLSSASTITVAEGIKGEGKAILRAGKDIESGFAEQSVLLAVGDVHLRGACVRCQVKCNGRLLLDSEKGSLVGGEVRASRGVVAQNVGSPGGTRTVVSFGQDFLVRDQIEREEQQVAVLAKKITDLDAAMLILQKRVRQAAGGIAGTQTQNSAHPNAASLQRQDAEALARARSQKLTCMKVMEQRKLRLIGLRDKFDEHVPSEVVVRGTLYPGAMLECHGRRYEAKTEKKMITLRFDPSQGRIVEKI